MARSEAQITTLASFNGANGQNPSWASLTLSDSTLYGITSIGGANSNGTVFSVPVGGGSPTTLATFTGSTSSGAEPQAGLTLSADSSTLYGTTAYGGTSAVGTVFSVPVSGGTPTILATFTHGNGASPYAGLTLSGGTLYGITTFGGANGDGTVFSVPVSGGTPTTLATFTGTNGVNPYGGLTLSGGILYGTTLNGGTGYGTVFSVPVGGGTITAIAFNNTNGANPQAGLTLSADGKTLYGTTEGGSGTHGTVFSVPVSGGTITTLATFNVTNGSNPQAGLTLSADGKTLYGATAGGGANGDGTVFSVPVGGGTITTLDSFNGSNGNAPYADLTLSADGSTLYGTTTGGGANSDGTVFSVPVPTPEPGSVTLLLTGFLAVSMRRRLRLARRFEGG